MPRAKGKAVPKSVLNLVKFYTINIDNFWDTVLTNLQQTQEQNTLLATEFSYEKVADRLSNIIKD
jgi:hypothetical protein